MYDKIGVIGIGLLGGSLCKALKMKFPLTEITAIGRSIEKLGPVLLNKDVDYITILKDVDYSDIDLIVVATPVLISIDIIKGILQHNSFNRKSLIIDLGSVKSEIIKSVETCINSDRFIGCHPMAGSEASGYEFSSSDLYDGATVIITPGEKNNSSDIDEIAVFWEDLNAETHIVLPEDHDRSVAFTSHLPHLVAGSVSINLSEYLKEKPGDFDILPFIGSGFRDLTRISSGSPEVWQDIVALNKNYIENSLSELINGLIKLKGIISKENFDLNEIYEYLDNGKKFRDSIK